MIPTATRRLGGDPCTGPNAAAAQPTPRIRVAISLSPTNGDRRCSTRCSTPTPAAKP